MLFRNKQRDKAEDLNRKVERFRKRWQEGRGDLTFERSNGIGERNNDRGVSDSSFVYYDES
jgi:hypothetical protein